MCYRVVRHLSFFSFLLAWCMLQLGCAAPQAQAASPERPEHAQTPDTSQESRTHAHDVEGQARCPTDLPNVVAEVRDVERGVSIAFTGPDDSVDAVRELTRQMALSYQRCQRMMQQHQEGMQQHQEGMQQHQEGMHQRQEGMHQRQRGQMSDGGPGGPRMGMMEGRRGPIHMMLGADIQVRERPDGAEIIMLAREPEHVDALRARERWHVEMMRLGHCPMMGMMREMEEEMEQEPNHEQ